MVPLFLSSALGLLLVPKFELFALQLMNWCIWGDDVWFIHSRSSADRTVKAGDQTQNCCTRLVEASILAGFILKLVGATTVYHNPGTQGQREVSASNSQFGLLLWRTTRLKTLHGLASPGCVSEYERREQFPLIPFYLRILYNGLAFAISI
ncbi:hypothetical protein BJ322DRAFT_61615 [Thelephora terrestris]|uniref:Secreted protein n=1 Tax=Thelephora terrestris TaxID=56493 RepID=A0A9P6LCM1_9AGAM|nr:hypothetical protein BJ322DRAFT_61615 [Thelephora terrestris]